MTSSESMNIFTIVTISIISACLILSCCEYILSQRKLRKRQEMEFINQCYAPKAQEQVFTIEIPSGQPPNNEQLSLNICDKPPPPYEPQMNMPSIANKIDQREHKQ